MSCSTEFIFGLALQNSSHHTSQLLIIKPSLTREINQPARALFVADATIRPLIQFGTLIFIQGRAGSAMRSWAATLREVSMETFLSGIGWISIRMGLFPLAFAIERNRSRNFSLAVHLPGSITPKPGWSWTFISRHHIDFIPFGDYSYHISEPPIGTDRNEFWGGVKVAFNF